MIEEEFKGWWHVGVGVIAAVTVAYNLMRFLSEQRKENAINVAIFAPLSIWEFKQAKRHFQSCPRVCMS